MQIMTKAAPKMECNFYIPMKMLQEIRGLDFLKEIGKREFGVVKRWDEEGVKEGVVGVIKREIKWMRNRGGLKSVVFDFDFGLLQIGEVVGVKFVGFCLEGKYKK